MKVRQKFTEEVFCGWDGVLEGPDQGDLDKAPKKEDPKIQGDKEEKKLE